VLTVRESLPRGLLDLEARRLAGVLPGPTLIHLPGRRSPPLFVALLLHGNEDVGWRALQELLGVYGGGELPRALSFFIGNVAAAAEGKRFLPGQPDYNRIWAGEGGSPEEKMTGRIVEEMRSRGVFASVDLHNNTGLNPHYACVRDLDDRSLQLATLFGRTVVLARKPDGIQMQALSRLCPSVTVECGRVAQERGVRHAASYVEACLRLSEIPEHPVPEHDIDLFHTVGIARMKSGVTFSFGETGADVSFRDDLDRLNFRELPPGTVLGRVKPGRRGVVEVSDESGREVADHYLALRDGKLTTTVPLTPSMLTLDAEAVRQDCLCYFMERVGSDGVSP
jgi:hypothetical protein